MSFKRIAFLLVCLPLLAWAHQNKQQNSGQPQSINQRVSAWFASFLHANRHADGGLEHKRQLWSDGLPANAGRKQIQLNRTEVQAYSPIEGNSEYWNWYQDSRASGSDLRDSQDTHSDEQVLPNYSYAGYDFANSAIPTDTDGTGYGDDVPEYDSQLSNYRVFNVADYGAIADDDISDKQAIKDTIAAAEDYVQDDSMGAIIYFPAGRFLVNEDSDMLFTDENGNQVTIGECDDQGVPCIGTTSDPGDDTLRANAMLQQPFYITKGNIIVRGSGSGDGGTELYMANHFVTSYANIMYNTPHLFMVGQIPDEYWLSSGSSDESSAYMALQEVKSQPSGTGLGAVITRITSSAKRDTTLTVTVEDVSALSVGQWVRLHSIDTRSEKISEALGPYEPEPWFSKTGIPWWKDLNRGLEQKQMNQIVAINPGTKSVTFAAPLNGDIEASTDSDNFGWVLETLESTQHIGFEDLAIVGNAPTPFVHHKNYVYDSGWSGIYLYKTVDSWVKNVTFTSMSEGVQAILSAAMTLQDITFNGNAGHLSVAIENSSSVLGLNITETTSTWHTAGFSSYSSGNVLLNATYPADTSPNLHATFPRSNLFDRAKGGWIHGHWGGDLGVTPNHMKFLTWWNPVNTSDAEDDWEFMQTDSKYGRVIMPYVIGMTGNVHTFASQYQYYAAQVDTHYTKTNATSGDGKDYIVDFTEDNSNCYETASDDTDDVCDLPSSVDDATTQITYTPVGTDADFPALTNPYADALPDDQVQAYVESAGTIVTPYSLYEAQLKYRKGVLPDWLVTATGKVRYVKFSVENNQDDSDTASSGTLTVKDEQGTVILSQTIEITSYPTDITLDLGDYYNLGSLVWTPDSDSDSLLGDYSFYLNKADLGDDDWGDASASGTFGSSYHSQIISLSDTDSTALSALASAEDDETTASAAVDDNVDTYWQVDTDGDWLSLDLQDELWLDGMQIAFYLGDSQVYSFDIEYSLDNSTWQALTDSSDSSDDFTSSGSSSALETFSFSRPVHARYVRIIAHGNDGDDDPDVFAISEVTVNVQDDPGLVSHMALDDGSGVSPTDAAGIYTPQLVNSLRANGLVLDGDDDYVSLGDIDANDDGQITVALWTKFSDQASTAFLLRKHSWGTSNPYYIQVTSGGVLSARVNGSGVSVSGLNDNAWHHVAMVLDGSSLTLYADGAAVDTTTVTPVSNDTAVTLGGDSTGRYPFAGSVDEVRIYQGALSAAQVKSLASQPLMSAQRGSCDSLAIDGLSSDSLAAYYPFEDADIDNISTSTSSCDASGNSHTATLVNGATWGDISSDNWNGEVEGVAFDGVDDYLTLGDIDYGDDNQLTVALWTKFSDQDATAFLLRKSNYGTSNPYYIQVTSGGVLSARVNGVGPSVTYLNDDAWHHVAMVLNGTELSLYVDGDYYDSATVTPVSNNTDVTLGGVASGSKMFKGAVDDVRIYTRALDADTISTLATASRYNAEGACVADAETDSDLQVFLPLQDKAEQTCDASGKGNAGQLSNGPTWQYQSTWLEFDGENDQVQMGDIGYGDGNGFSASLWAKFDSQDDVAYLLQKAVWLGDSPFNLYARTDGAIRTGVMGTEAEASGLADGNWHHLVSVLDDTLLSLFVDGELVSTATVSPDDDSGVLTLGGATGSATVRPFRGAIDEVRIYQKAIDADKVLALYQLSH